MAPELQYALANTRVRELRREADEHRRALQAQKAEKRRGSRGRPARGAAAEATGGRGDPVSGDGSRRGRGFLTRLLTQ